MSHPADPAPHLLALEAEVRRLRGLLERVRTGLVRVQARIGEAIE